MFRQRSALRSQQLIANGKAGHAVDIAKQVHKRLGNAASEELLVDAYVARIFSLAERNLDAEASALLESGAGSATPHRATGCGKWPPP